MSAPTPTTLEDVQDAVRSHGPVVPHGAQTKQPLATAHGARPLDMRRLTGIIEYQPEEFTFTAYAGTPLHEIEAMLAEHGQYLPFEPPLVEQGATLAGTIAAGLSGSGQKRYGGVRDFIIGTRLVDGTGQLIRGGGKVVKNAAGFDLPKLMVGSCGRLGVIVEATFKVFPAPEAQRTLRLTCHSLDDALERMAPLSRQPFDLEALDLEPPATLTTRLSGNEASIDAHAERIATFIDRPYEWMSAAEAARYWRSQRSFDWLPADHHLVKFAVTPRCVPMIEQAVQAKRIPRRYAVGANLAWLAWPVNEPWPDFTDADLAGLIVRGPDAREASARVGTPSRAAAPFAQRIKQAMDPQQRFAPLI